MKRLTVTASTIALCSLGFAQVTTPQAVVPAAPQPAQSQPGAVANTQVAPEDAQFVKKASSSGIYEVKSSETATTASENANVKAFAQRMIQDHTAANQELKSLAQQKNIPLPDTLSTKHQNMLTKLAAAQPNEFDRLYVTQQTKAHEEAVALFREAVASVKDPQLKAFAEKTLPKLEAHLAEVKQLNSANE